jgi:hypothetical protein
MDNFNTPDLDQGADSILRPGETLDDFDVTFRKPNAEGGFQQLVQNTDDGSRPGYAGVKGQDRGAVQNLYDQFGKNVINKLSREKFGKNFDKVEGGRGANARNNFVARIKEKGPLSLKELQLAGRDLQVKNRLGIQLDILEDLKKGPVTVEALAKKYKVSQKVIKEKGTKLLKNIYNKNVQMGKGVERGGRWLPDDDVTIDKILNNISKSPKLAVIQKDQIGRLFYDAFGREKLSNGKKNPTYNSKKYTAILKNLNEYNNIKKIISDKYPNIKLELDHPLSKSTLRKVFNASVDELVAVNPLERSLNQGFKKSLSDNYEKAITGEGNIKQKKAIEKIAKDLNINIGNVSNDFSKYKTGTKSFEKLNIKDEVLKSMQTQADLNSNLKGYVKQNPDLFKTANVNPNTNITKVTQRQVKDMETMLVKLCPRGGNSSGGRIGFSLGSGAACGAKFLEARLKDGKGLPVQRRLMADIIATGAGIKNFAKNMLNPLELLNPKNLIGPQAIALMGAFEVGDVTYDVINNNKPITEALGDNWILKYASPYNQEEEQVKAVQAKNISGSPAMQTYMKKVKLQAEFERENKKLEKLKKDTPSKNNPKVQEQIKEQQAVVDNLKNNWQQFVINSTVDVNGEQVLTLESGKQDFEKAFGQVIDKRQGGEFVAGDEKQSLMKTYMEGKSEDKYINTGSDLINQGDPLSYKYKKDSGKDQGRNLSETEREAEKLFPFEQGSLRADYTPSTYKNLNYTPQKLPVETRQEYENLATKQGILPPRTSLSQTPMRDGSTYDYLKDLTELYNNSQKAKQASMYPGYGGTQEPAKYAEGGLAGLMKKYNDKR